MWSYKSLLFLWIMFGHNSPPYDGWILKEASYMSRNRTKVRKRCPSGDVVHG